jgi:Icc-related predicted phosphoesterase
MRICFTSDLHGILPDIPKCETLVIAGDICPRGNRDIGFQLAWLNKEFIPWTERQPCHRVVGCWGNHDSVGQSDPYLVPERLKFYTDKLVDINGLLFFFSPWQRVFHNWAFNLNEPDLDRKYSQIPHCHILVTHGPPYGYGDLTALYDDNPVPEHVGSKMLLSKIDDIKPLIACYGHIHSGYGLYRYGPSVLLNASLVDNHYHPKNKVFLFDVDQNKVIQVD